MTTLNQWTFSNCTLS